MTPHIPSRGSAPSTRGRGRRWVGWMLLVLGVAVSGAWVASRWWHAQVRKGAGEVKISSGRLSLVVWNSEGAELMKELSDEGSGLYATVPANREWKMWLERGKVVRFPTRPLAEMRYLHIPL